MLSVPSLQLRIRHSDQLMGDSTILLVHRSLLTDRVSPPLRDEIDPEVVVDATGGDASKKSVQVRGDDVARHLHSKTRQAVRGIEEAHRACVNTTLWRNPRHDKQKDFD
jgi:hypothetical protein